MPYLHATNAGQICGLPEMELNVIIGSSGRMVELNDQNVDMLAKLQKEASLMGEKYSKASVSYGDAKGTVAVDWHPTESDIHYWYKRFDGPDSHYPVAMSIYCGEHGHVSVSVSAVEKNTDMNEFDSVRDYLADAGKNEAVPVIRVSDDVPLDEVFAKMKRCQILLFSRGFHNLDLTLECTEG